mmetsp:Transcript_95273/g.116641  ORF Transcript_95273/g.116641 Transcript_95273/m.116641 type:complete len:237 (-) Transcript_95273:182-892(-)
MSTSNCHFHNKHCSLVAITVGSRGKGCCVVPPAKEATVARAASQLCNVETILHDGAHGAALISTRPSLKIACEAAAMKASLLVPQRITTSPRFDTSNLLTCPVVGVRNLLGHLDLVDLTDFGRGGRCLPFVLELRRHRLPLLLAGLYAARLPGTKSHGGAGPALVAAMFSRLTIPCGPVAPRANASVSRSLLGLLGIRRLPKCCASATPRAVFSLLTIPCRSVASRTKTGRAGLRL